MDAMGPQGESTTSTVPRTGTMTAPVSEVHTNIRTPDQRVRVFISSTLEELAEERQAAKEAVSHLRLTPVMFELGARPHPPRSLYRAYLAQSDIFIGIYWQRYGWIAPGEEVSGLEDEYCLSGERPKLIYIKRAAPEREPRLQQMLDRIEQDDTASYKLFSTPEELRELIENDLALLLTEFFDRARTPQSTDGKTRIAARALRPFPRSGLPIRRRLVATLATVTLVTALPVFLWLASLQHTSAPQLAAATHSAFQPWGQLRIAAVPWGRPSGVAVDRDRNMYVVDAAKNRVEKLSPQGQLLDQWGTNSPGTRQLNDPSGIALDGRGHAYLADAGNDRIVKLEPHEGIVTVWQKDTVPGRASALNNPLIHPLGLAIDRRDYIYVANTGGNNSVSISSDGKDIRGMPGWRGSALGEMDAPSALAVDSHGTIYIADTANHRIQIFSATYTPLQIWGSADSRTVHFQAPTGIAIDGQDNVYVADGIGDDIQKLSPHGQVLARWGGTGSRRGEFIAPTGIAVDPQGNIYVADSGNARVQELSPRGRVLAQWVGAWSPQSLHFADPSALTADAHGNVYVVSNEPKGWMQKLSPSGRLLEEWAANPSGRPAALTGMAVDTAGRIYIVDELNNRIRRFSSHGSPLADWKAQLAEELDSPSSIAIDGGGNLYLVDSGNKRVLKLSPTGRLLRQYGTYGFGSGQLLWPRGLALDAHGNVYVTDMQLQSIEKFSAAGKFLARWGTKGSGWGQFDDPVAVAVNRNGVLYIVDEGNNRIQQISSDGRPLASWGRQGSSSGQFRDPIGVVLDRAGHVYVADRGNNRIQRLVSKGSAEPGTKVLQSPAPDRLSRTARVHQGGPE